ncbi:MAG: SDR family NAD(P)-dependent oxidoreductase [Sandaracinaceae bacterium]|nr:SDR family NAD(P)-dependent oxidoreductase [Sandaracinaceae bacterium]
MSDEYEIFESDIAIVGMAARVPGARNPREYWRNLAGGVESIRFFSDEELIAAGVSRADLEKKSYVRASAPLDDMELFDGEFFGFSPKESAIMDPQHRHFLECCWEALESAGHPPERFEGPIGVFAGCGMGSYFYFNLCTRPELVRDVGMFLLRHTGNDKDFLSTRVSYLFDLRGPAVGIQTACSTSLVAVHVAAQSLLARECDLALAGGVTVLLPHRQGYHYEEGEILSPDGHCHAFDHRAQGTVFGSGAGVVALRRLEDALDDGDVIHAVIRGSAINNDGSTKVNYLAPSVDGQATCMVEAFGVGQIDPRTIGYVECHGTGTYLGDPIEIEALTQAFRTGTQDRGFCRIGSVKTNIGHLDTAAGVASLIKATLALENATFPPSLGYEKPNATIDFASSPFVVNDRATPWPAPSEHPRRAGVNSLGVGGTNGFVVLQEPPGLAPGDEPTRRFSLLMISAKSGPSLDGNTANLAAYLREHPDANLGDVAWTLHHGRRAFERRRVVAAASVEEAARLLEEQDPRRVFTHTAPERASTVFLLPGGGAQYPRMAIDLHAHEPVFREHLDRGLALLRERHGIDLEPLLFAAPDAVDAANAELDRMPSQLPAIFLTSVAMARLFESWGVRPQALLGHSLGQNTAAHLAGVMSFEDCLGLVVLRGRLFEKTAEGAMLSVNLPADAVAPLLGDALDLAVLNAPDATVVSGPPAAIDALAARLATMEEVEAKRLAIPTAAHSRLLDPILDEFGAYLRSIRLTKPTVPFLCNVTGTWITDAQATSPEYWVKHLRSTVRFADDVATLLAGQNRVLIECGPGRALSSLVRAHPDYRKGTHNALSSIRHRDEAVDDQAFFTACLGRIWASGGTFDVDALWPGEAHVRVELPTYAWNHKYFFIEPGKVQVADPGTDLVKIPDVERWGWRPIWKPALTDPRRGEPHTWLLFMDQAGVGKRLKERLEASGDRVVAVYEGDAYLQRGEREFSLSPERGKEGYAALVRDLVAAGATPDRVVHLWLLEAKETFRPGSSLFHHHQERGFFSLFFLAQALADESVPGPLHLSVILNGLMQVDGEPVAYPDKATALGPVKVVPRELEGVTASLVDVELPRQSERLFGGTLRMAIVDPFSGRRRVEQELDALVDRLEEELRSPPKSALVAWRGPKRFEQMLDATALPPAARPPLRQGGCYLITGGLGGLGLTFAEWLAREAKAKLVLLSRSPVPPRAQWAEWMRQHGPEDRTSKRLRRLLDVEEAGGEVMVVAADVTNVLELREAVAEARERFGPVQGVLHTAGVVADELIALKTQEQVEDVFTPKIQGTLVLSEVFASEPPLDFLVLFSSTSTATAPAGQVDYVAANAFLDAYAQSRASEATRVVSVHWGLWAEVGMAAAQLDTDRPAAGTPVGEQPGHAVLTARVADGRGQTLLSGVLSPATHWLLDEHRTKAGHALVPGTGYLELARAALRANGERGPFEIEDLFFIRPLAVADDARREIRVALRPTARGYALEVGGEVDLDGRRGWEVHAQAHLALGELAAPAPLDVAAIERRCARRALTLDPSAPDPSAIVTPQERHLRFGPRWRVLRSGGFGDGEAFARLSLAAAHAGEVAAYGLHPALLDIATGWAMELIEGYAADHLWVPVGYERVRVHGDLPPSVVSWVRGHDGNADDADFVYFDVTLADPESGRVVLEVDRLALRKMAGDVDFAVKSRPSARDVELDASEDAAREPSPAEVQLARNLTNGILPDEGRDALARVLAGPRLPEVFVSSLDLDGLVAQAALALPSARGGEGIKLARPDLDSEYVEARDEVERTLVGFWQELLGVDAIGVEDSFFDLGGHSLIAVRLFAKVKKAYEVEFPISVLFEAPTVSRCAELIKARIGGEGASAPKREAPRTRFTHLVAMHPGEGGPKTPFFLVAGMFGNVLNLRHLAHLVGMDRRFYGLQARGLYGDQPPHETFEEMAEAYIAEMRAVQPHGPYLLGGFSGGGITAYEIAQQLRAAGEEVARLVFLDTPLPSPPPRLSMRDRALIQFQQLGQKGPAYVSEWAVNRWNWELGKLRARFDDAEPDRGADVFHDEAIEAAFRRALGRYALRPWPGAVTLFRPKLEVAFDLGNGRKLDYERGYVFEDNGWTPYVGHLDVFEVPGDHDSMVLEPNVRVLAGRLRAVIEGAENELRARARERARAAE